MREDLHIAITYLSGRAFDLLAHALRGLRRLSAADAWLRLVGATAREPATLLGVVLRHHLSGLLLTTDSEVFHHG